MHVILFLKFDAFFKKSLALLWLVCLATLNAYQWPAVAAVDGSFLQQNQDGDGFNFGIHFKAAEQAVAFAAGEIIYHSAEKHLASLPGEAIIVLEHKNWQIGYYARNMQTTFSNPAKIAEGEVLLSKTDSVEESELYTEFYDYKTDRLVSPWLMLPPSPTLQTSRQFIVVIESTNFSTTLRSISYFYPENYSLLFSGNRIPLWIESEYADELHRLDLSSVSERQGLLYTNEELTAVEDLAVSGLLKINEFEITPPLRGTKPMNLRFSFNGSQIETDNYSFYTLPPENNP